jgi:hypothetical protein
MPNRLDKTLADYLVIAISPALIMTLVGSLVFFLLEVFYRGHFEGRLQFIMAMFVMAAVLIARISIEDGSEKATAYAMALGLLTMAAIYRFVDGGVLVSIALLGLIWWCAHKLTWDCTLIDEEQDASGEGLLQVVGLDESPAAGQAAAEQPAELEGIRLPEAEPAPWWQRLFRPDKRHHAPGVWIVYFSLAALPVFGIGQRLVPADDVEGRRYVFWLLCIYVASGLGLLLTTSFLGLRRYLRQRHLQMPASMAGVWIVTGSVLAAALLAAAAILPRPASEYAISELPFGAGAANRRSSQYAVGDEGVEDNKRQPRAGSPEQQNEPPATEPKDAGKQSGNQSGGDSSEQKSEGAEQKPGKENSSDQGGGKQPDGKAQDGGSQQQDGSGGQKSNDSGSTKQGQDQGQSKGGQSGEKSDQSRSQDGASQEKSENQPDSQSEAQPSESQSGEDEGSTSSSQSQPSPMTRLLPETMGGWLTTLFRWVLFAAIAVVGGIWLWRSWDKVLAGFRDLFADVRAFLARLFGVKKTAVSAETKAEEPASGPPPRPFSAFADPFATGMADRAPPEELVRYSFDALEAWAREQGWPREEDQTPHEFAQQVGTKATALSRDARRLADLYCSVAYFQGAPPGGSVESLRRFWRQLASVQPPRAVSNT